MYLDLFTYTSNKEEITFIIVDEDKLVLFGWLLLCKFRHSVILTFRQSRNTPVAAIKPYGDTSGKKFFFPVVLCCNGLFGSQLNIQHTHETTQHYICICHAQTSYKAKKYYNDCCKIDCSMAVNYLQTWKLSQPPKVVLKSLVRRKLKYDSSDSKIINYYNYNCCNCYSCNAETNVLLRIQNVIAVVN